MEQRTKHRAYFIALLLLMISVFILSSPLLVFFISFNKWVSYILTAVVAYVLGHVCSKVIEKITHKEKKEILAGTIIPIPAMISLSAFIIIARTFSGLTTLNSVLIGLLYFFLFNVPFLGYLYEHEKHKHHLIGFLFAPMFLAFVYTLAFLVASILASYSTAPLVEESIMYQSEYTEVSNFVNDCARIVAKEKIRKGFVDAEEFNSYVNSNINNCINDFEVFRNEGYDIKTKTLSTETLIGEKYVVIKIHYPVVIKEGIREKLMSKFRVVVERGEFNG